MNSHDGWVVKFTVGGYGDILPYTFGRTKTQALDRFDAVMQSVGSAGARKDAGLRRMIKLVKCRVVEIEPPRPQVECHATNPGSLTR